MGERINQHFYNGTYVTLHIEDLQSVEQGAFRTVGACLSPLV